MKPWEMIVMIFACICCSGGIAWLFIDMHRLLKEWDEIKKKNKEHE